MSDATRIRALPSAEAIGMIVGEVGSWPGVTTAEHRFGGVEFRHGRRELGHLHDHGSHPATADLPVPRALRDTLIAEGRARAHHWLPDSGWVTVPLTTPAAAADVVVLLREAYDRSARVAARRTAD